MNVTAYRLYHEYLTAAWRAVATSRRYRQAGDRHHAALWANVARFDRVAATNVAKRAALIAGNA